MSANPLFGVARLEDSACVCNCGFPAAFLIMAAMPGADDVENVFCHNCAVVYTLQRFKLEGVELAAIAEVFPKLSAALEAPPSSPFVM